MTRGEPRRRERKAAGIYRGAFWAVSIQWTTRLVGLASVVILARLLSPKDFGLVSLALIATAFVELIGAVGFRQALLRIREPSREHFDTAWTIQLLLFWAMGILTILVAPLIAHFFERPDLATIMIALSARNFCLGLVNIGIVEFDRELDFARDLRMRIAARLGSFVITIGAAALLRNYWALVIGLVAYSALLLIASFAAHPYRPRLSLSRRAELFGTSWWIFVAALAQWMQMQIERMVLGRFASAHLIGLFSVSKDLSIIFTHEIATALNRVTFVAVAREGKDLSGQRERVTGILGAYAMIAAAAGFGLAATAEDMVAVLLGREWAAAAPYLQVVATYSAFFAVYKSIAAAVQAAGGARAVAIISLAGASVLAIAAAAAALAAEDAMAVALAALGGNLLLLIGGVVVIARRAELPIVTAAASVFRPFAAAAVMAALVRYIAPATQSPLLDLAAGVTAGLVIYPLALFTIWSVCGRPGGAEAEAARHLHLLRARLLGSPVAQGWRG